MRRDAPLLRPLLDSIVAISGSPTLRIWAWDDIPRARGRAEPTRATL
ncbi:MAG TPA: hypothetical protein VES40_14475 [Ilumatobacteraceae bacterium]|nr:hypothetical protein [Ilumatobacteraceae bacterium]